MARLMIAFAKISIAVFLILISSALAAQSIPQNPQAIYNNNIHTVRFNNYGNQLSLPIYRLNSGDRLELAFDDMDADVKNYYYTYQLCDYNWQPVDLSPFDYIKGFTQMRISTYRYSSIAYTKYTHYMTTLPDASSMPSRSGNYLIKVFLDGDTTKLVFTRSLLVVQSKASIGAQVIQPFSPQYYTTHQRVSFSVNVKGLDAFSAAQQLKVLVLQNYRWDNAQGNVQPTFVRNNNLEYNSESNFIFPAGKEWRWVDLQSLRLQSDREDSIVENKKNFRDVYVRTDGPRAGQKYLYYYDLNGFYNIETYESINPYWQSDYATVHFRFAPPDHMAYADKDIYLLGQLTDYKFDDASKMKFNEEKGIYETTAYLKQGYYSYGYLLVDKKGPSQTMQPDGDYYETENNYTILVYYKSFTDQSDQLIGVSTIDSRSDKPGVSF